MKTFLSICALVTLTAAAAAQAPAPQAPAPAPAVATTTMAKMIVHSYENIRDLLVKTADKMPAEDYAFQPTPDVRTFAGNLGHILTSDISQCGTLLGRKHALAGQDLSKTLTTKAELVKAAADTFAFCDEYFKGITDATAIADTYFTVTGRRGGQPITAKVSHGASIVQFLTHNNEEYGYLAVYMRLKGIVPPSSTPATPK